MKYLTFFINNEETAYIRFGIEGYSRYGLFYCSSCNYVWYGAEDAEMNNSTALEEWRYWWDGGAADGS